jgi:uncharacterized protein YndB with AHSA1/START domain
MEGPDPERVIREEVVVDAAVEDVWNAWTTEAGIRTFFAPAARVDLGVDGLYEILFDPRAEAGQRGAEGMRILALQPKKMLAFTWSAPPHLPGVRMQRTHVVVRFREVSGGRTRVVLTHDGWGEGEEWDEAFAYFSKAWRNTVLPRLKQRFLVGPIDWDRSPGTQQDRAAGPME